MKESGLDTGKCACGARISVAAEMCDKCFEDPISAAKKEIDHLRNELRRLSEITWSGENCTFCGKPTAETEYILGNGICERCFDRNTRRDDLKKQVKERMEGD